MPRDKGQDHMIPMSYPVTGEEVAEMFRSAPSQPPFPSTETCNEIAMFLSNHMPQGLEERRKRVLGDYQPYQLTEEEQQYRKRWTEAVRVLRDMEKYPGSFPGASNIQLAASSVSRVLNQAEKLLDAVPRQTLETLHPQLKPWAIVGAMTVMLAQTSIQDLTNHVVGVTEKSRAARFAEQAISRIGWRDARGETISAGALAKYYARLMT